MPRLDTLENVMRVSQMIIQAQWGSFRSPFLQLPHIQEYSDIVKKVTINMNVVSFLFFQYLVMKVFLVLLNSNILIK